MIFLTVGTTHGFDRLVAAVDELAAQGRLWDRVYAQIGHGSYKPKNMEYERTLNRNRFQMMCEQATAIVSHAGMGVISTALEYHKPLLAVPRLCDYGEVVSDHQLPLAEHFCALGCLLLARDIGELATQIEKLRDFVPAPRIVRREPLVARIQAYLDQTRKLRGYAHRS